MESILEPLHELRQTLELTQDHHTQTALERMITIVYTLQEIALAAMAAEEPLKMWWLALAYDAVYAAAWRGATVQQPAFRAALREVRFPPPLASLYSPTTVLPPGYAGLTRHWQ